MLKDYVSIDLETTGFSAEKNEIIEIGAWKVIDNVPIEKFSRLIKPVMYIPRIIQDITGITMDDVSACEPIDVILPEFFSWCGDLPFLGHNLPFDYEFLKQKGKRLGLDFSLNKTRQGIDTLKLCRNYLKLESNKLGVVADFFDIHVQSGNLNYHRAEYDSYITKLIYDRFLLNYQRVFEIINPHILDVDDTQYGKVVLDDTLDFS